MRYMKQGALWALLLAFLFAMSGCSNLEDAEGLYRQGDTEEALDVAIGFLDDSNPEVRIEAAGLVGRIGGKKAAEALIVLLKDEEENVVVAAIKGMGQSRYTPIGQVLTELTPTAQGSVFDATAKAFERLGTEGINPLVAAFDDASALDAKAYRAMLVQIGPAVSKSIVASFKGKRADQNQKKLAVLVDLRSPRVPGLLIEMVGDPEVAQMIVRSLVQLGSMSVDPAVKELTKYKGSDEGSLIKELLCRALGDIKSRRAVPILEAMAKDSSDLVRAAADGALVKVRGF